MNERPSVSLTSGPKPRNSTFSSHHVCAYIECKSEIAEIRKLFHDLIAPDLQSVATDLDAFKASVDHQFKALKKSIETKVGALEAVEEGRYLAVIAKIETIRIEFAAAKANHIRRHEAVLKALDVDKRLEKIEAQLAASMAA